MRLIEWSLKIFIRTRRIREILFKLHCSHLCFSLNCLNPNSQMVYQFINDNKLQQFRQQQSRLNIYDSAFKYYVVLAFIWHYSSNVLVKIVNFPQDYSLKASLIGADEMIRKLLCFVELALENQQAISANTCCTSNICIRVLGMGMFSQIFALF